MPRPPRILLSHSYYHIMTRGNNRHDVFRDDDDFLYYLDLINRFKAAHPFDLFHYCLMKNHVHMLVRTNKASDFSTFMKKINLAYFHHYQQKYEWVGHFWQGRFKSQPIGKDTYFIQCGKYIELNPVRSKKVDSSSPGDYPYSSYRHYSEGTRNTLITDNLFYENIGASPKERQEAYSEMVICDIIGNNYLKNVWGSDRQRYQESRKIKRQLNKK